MPDSQLVALWVRTQPDQINPTDDNLASEQTSDRKSFYVCSVHAHHSKFDLI